MRHTFLLIILLFTLGAKAQVTLGVRASQGTHGVYFEPTRYSIYQKALMGSSAGLVFVTCTQDTSKALNGGIKLELNYAQKGWKDKAKATDEFPDSYYIRHLNYIEFPVLSHGEIFKGPFKLVINAGPVLSYKIQDEVEQYLWDQDYRNYGHYGHPVKDFHLGIRTAGGFKYTIKEKLSLYAEVRYNVEMAGASDLFIDRPELIQASRMKELSFGFGLTWTLKTLYVAKKKDIYVPKQGLEYNFGEH